MSLKPVVSAEEIFLLKTIILLMESQEVSASNVQLPEILSTRRK